VALTFLEIRVIFGVTGLDQPFNWATLETIVWLCVGTSLLIADIANQIYDLKISRPRLARAPEPEQSAVVASRSS